MVRLIKAKVQLALWGQGKRTGGALDRSCEVVVGDRVIDDHESVRERRKERQYCVVYSSGG